MANRAVLSKKYHFASSRRIYRYENEECEISPANLLGYVSQDLIGEHWNEEKLDPFFDELYEKVNFIGEYTQITDFVWNINETIQELNLKWELEPASLLMMLTYQNSGICFFAGDIRFYSIEQGELKKLSNEHILANQWIEKGIMKPSEAKKEPGADQLTKYIGMKSVEETIEMTKAFHLYEGQKFVICSKEVCNHLSEDDLAEYVEQDRIDELEELLNGVCGHDNWIFEVVEVESSETIVIPRPPIWPKLLKALAAMIVIGAVGFGGYSIFNKVEQKVPKVKETKQTETEVVQSSQKSDENDKIEEDISRENNEIVEAETPESVDEDTTIETKDFISEEVTNIEAKEDSEVMDLKNEDIDNSKDLEQTEVVNEQMDESSDEKIAYNDNNAESYKTYVLQKGDNLYKVSNKFYGDGSRVNDIIELNNIKDANSVPAGYRLKLPN